MYLWRGVPRRKNRKKQKIFMDSVNELADLDQTNNMITKKARIIHKPSLETNETKLSGEQFCGKHIDGIIGIKI